MSEFGFFFEDAPATLIPIFDPADQDSATTAAILFALDLVADADEGFTLQSTFVPSPAAVGFYITLGDALGGLTLRSTPTLQGGFDSFAAFPFLGSSDTFFLNFQVNPADPDSLLATYVLTSLSPSVPSQIPAPAGTLLLGSGLAGLLAVVAWTRRSYRPRRRYLCNPT